MNKLLSASMFVALVASHSAFATGLPFLDHVVSADEFSHNKQLRKQVVDACVHGDIALRKDPNCINAGKSLSKDQVRNDVPDKF